MELRQYWDLLRKWLWLIALTAIIGAAASYLVSIRQTPIYQASARLLVTQGSSSNPTVTYSDILLAERLSRTYAQMLSARPVLEAAIARLGLQNVSASSLAGQVSVQSVRDTQLISLRVEHASPELAVEIANTLPVVFVEYNGAQRTSRYQESKKGLEAQLAQLGADIAETETQLAAIKNVAGAEAASQRLLLENRLAQYRSSYGNVLSQFEGIRLAEANDMESVIVVEPAVKPTRPIRPRVMVNVLLAGIVGAILGLSAAFVIEYLDDTVKNPDGIRRVTDLSTLGVIARETETTNAMITLENPRSPIAEAYRSIRTALQFASIDKPLRSLVVTSSGPGEGKSTTAANLAVVMAQAGKRTVLIDADLRKPTQHKRWKLPNGVGLTGALLFGENHDDFDQLLSKTSVDNLWLLTSGQIPHNPSELLGSNKLHHFIERLLERYDLLIFDSPPALAVTDPVVLGQAVDGVLLVVDAGTTREPALAQAVNEMKKVNANVIGVALNKFKARGDSGYYYYYYNRYYEEDGSSGAESGSRHGAAKGRGKERLSLGDRLLRAVRRS